MIILAFGTLLHQASSRADHPSSFFPWNRILQEVHSSLTVAFSCRWYGTPQPRAVQPLETVTARLISVFTYVSEDGRDRSRLR